MTNREPWTLPNGTVFHWKLGIVCTDRGRHKKLRLATVQKVTGISGEPEYVMPLARSWGLPDPAAEPNSITSRTAYGFYCDICNRHVRIERDRWWLRIEQVAEETDLDDVDLSLLG